MSTKGSTQSLRRAGPPGAWVLAMLALCGVWPGAARAAEVRTGDSVVVGAGEVIEDDLYAFGREVTIYGTVRGDVVTAARKLTLQGTVEGDVLSAAQETQVTGQTRGSYRGASRNFSMGAPVGKDALLAGEHVKLLPSANVAGDVFVAGNTVEVQSPVGGDVQAAAQSLTLAAPVQGNMRAEVGSLQLNEGARIGGDLRFAAQREAKIPSGAVAGTVERLPAREQQDGGGVAGFLYLWARSIVGLFALGLVLALVTPRLAERTTVVLREQPWRSLGWGVVAFVVTPILAAVLLLVGLVVGGWWLGVFALALYALALLASFPVVGLLLGRWLMERLGRHGTPVLLALLVGLVLLTLARRVPIVGGLIALATMLFGLGALLLALRRQRAPAAAPA